MPNVSERKLTKKVMVRLEPSFHKQLKVFVAQNDTTISDIMRVGARKAMTNHAADELRDLA